MRRRSRDRIELVVGRESITYYVAGAALDRAGASHYNALDDGLTRDHPRLRRVLRRLSSDGALAPMVLHDILRHTFLVNCLNCGAPARRSLLEFLTPAKNAPWK